jgi:hypothetical protein
MPNFTPYNIKLKSLTKLIYTITLKGIITLMCDFTDYGIADKLRMKKRISEEEDWDTEPELEKVQEEREEHVIVTQ